MHDEHKHTDGDPGYETRDVPGSLVFWSLTGLAIVTVISAIFVFGFFVYLRALPDKVTPTPSPFASDRMLPPTPRLQANPPLDLKEYNEKMDTARNTYGWVDKSKGVAHIPVDTALEIVAERGLPHGEENHVSQPLPAAAPTGEQPEAQQPAADETAQQ
ncbi:MAG: hypothetical protein AMXMBFR82_29430 [Candidatus Hydrogenedentota bacterium]